MTSLLTKNLKRNLSDNVDNYEVSTLDVTDFKVSDQFSNVDVIIGADVIYDFEITDGIINTIKMLICQKPFKPKKIWFSVEKRFIFSVDSLDTMAPAFDYFVTLLEDLRSDLFVNDNIVLSIDFLTLSTIKQSFCYERSKELAMIEFVSSLSL